MRCRVVGGGCREAVCVVAYDKALYGDPSLHVRFPRETNRCYGCKHSITVADFKFLRKGDCGAEINQTVYPMDKETMNPSTMEQVQAGWKRRWADKAPDPRPSCFNRADYAGWLPGCPHWKAGGNAR